MKSDTLTNTSTPVGCCVGITVGVCVGGVLGCFVGCSVCEEKSSKVIICQMEQKNTTKKVDVNANITNNLCLGNLYAAS